MLKMPSQLPVMGNMRMGQGIRLRESSSSLDRASQLPPRKWQMLEGVLLPKPFPKEQAKKSRFKDF